MLLGVVVVEGEIRFRGCAGSEVCRLGLLACSRPRHAQTLLPLLAAAAEVLLHQVRV